MNDNLKIFGFLCVSVICLAGISGFGGSTVTTESQLQERETKLRESIDRLTGQREQVRNELISLKQEQRQVLADMAQTTNASITIKITIPLRTVMTVDKIKVEQE